MSSLVDVDPVEPGFMWDGRIPIGHMTVVAGAPAMGKSMLGYLIAAETGVPTLFVTEEEHQGEALVPKFVIAGGDRAKGFHAPELRFSDKLDDFDHFASLIDEHGIKLIVVDPIQHHLDASMAHDQRIRRLMRPYMEVIYQRKVALVLECHVLTHIKEGNPSLAIPSGLRTWTKAGYVLAPDPGDPDFRILACAKWNSSAKAPASLRFEFAGDTLSARRFSGRGRTDVEFGYLVKWGEVNISATTLVTSLSKQTSENKMIRAGMAVLKYIKEHGKDGRSARVVDLKAMINNLDPPLSWKSATRWAKEEEVESIPDPQNRSQKWWVLPDHLADTLEEMTEPEDEIEIEEIEIPDAPPAEWDEEEEA